MRDASWPNSLHFAEPSAWRAFVTEVASPPLVSRAPVRRLDQSRRAASANWWALGITLGLFAGSTLLHSPQQQSLDCLRAGTALLRKRHGGALTPAATAAQYFAPQESERGFNSPECNR